MTSRNIENKNTNYIVYHGLKNQKNKRINKNLIPNSSSTTNRLKKKKKINSKKFNFKFDFFCKHYLLNLKTIDIF